MGILRGICQPYRSTIKYLTVVISTGIATPNKKLNWDGYSEDWYNRDIQSLSGLVTQNHNCTKPDVGI